MKNICRVCESEFGLFPGKPGKIDECEGCAQDIPVYWAEQGQMDDGTVETMTTKPMSAKSLTGSTVITNWSLTITDPEEEEGV